MKTTLVFLVLCLLSSLGSLQAEGSRNLVIARQMQQKTVTLNFENRPIREILLAIQKQSGIDFMITKEVEQQLSKVSIKVDKISVEQVLDLILKGSNFTFSVVDGICTFKRRPAETKPNKVRVNGHVLDDTFQPLIGVTVAVVNTNNGVITDDKGAFTLLVNSTDKLIISYVGMKTVNWDKPFPTDRELRIILEKEIVAIDDVVVNGVFERKSNTFTGSVTTIKNEELKRVGNSNVLQSLKNIDPSIMFFDNMTLGSDPNAVPQMVLRGKSNLAIGEVDLKATYQYDPNAPLFILDGFEVSIQKVMDLDMNRVESLTILKDASAKAIYGSKAANGVIVIELKKNHSGQLRITYNGSVEIQAPDLSSYNLTNSAEKLEIEELYGIFYDEAADIESNMAMGKLYNQRLSFVQSGINTNWMAKPLTTGIGTKHGIAVELGESDLKSIVDLSYNDVKGVMKGSDRMNLSGGISINYRHKKFLFRNQLTINSNTSNDSKYGSFDQYTKLNPYYTPYDAYGRISENIIPQIANLGGQSIIIDAWYRDIGFESNPLYDAQLNTVLRRKYMDVINNFDLQWNMTTSLKLTARLGLIEKRDKNDTFYPSNHTKFKNMTGENAFRRGSYTLSQGQYSTLTGKVDLQYTKFIREKHNIYINLGYDLSQRRTIENITQAEGFPSDKMNDIMFARQYLKDGKPGGDEQTVRDMGYYASASYSYDSRFNADATFRQSASSMYGASSRWGMFWSTGVSWNLHNETWMKNSIFSQLRLRASIGSTGSQSSAAYNAIALYNYYLDRNYEGMLGTTLEGMHNPDLRWQDKFDTNIAIDLNIRKRFALTFEYYNSLTNNALNPIALVPSTGFESVKENIGQIRNRGFEVRANYLVWHRSSERSSFSINIAALRNKNTLIEVSDAMRSYNANQNAIFNKTYTSTEFEKRQVETTRPVNKFYDGVSMDAIWAVRSLGIDPANGMEIFLLKDKNGNFYRSYNYDPNSQVICGDQLPKIQGNAGFNLEYRGLGLNCVLRYQYGAQMYNATLVDKVENANIRYNLDRRIYADRWRKPGDKSLYKRIQKVEVSDKNTMTSESTKPTSRFVQDRNELTISSIQISYDFYRLKFLKRMRMERLRLAINVNDVYTFSTIEIERGTGYPFARVFNGSLTFTF